MTLALCYLGIAALSWKYLTKEKFDQAIQDQSMSKSYSEELYQYTIDIEEIKLLHAGTLICITAFLTYMTCGNKVMSKTHYSNLIALTFLFTMLYFLPCLFIAKKTYDQNGEEGRGAKMFADWTFILIRTTDVNVIGLGFSIFVHAQIFMVIFGMQFLTFALKNAIRRLESLRDSGRSAYSNQELNSILNTNDQSIEETEMRIPSSHV